MHKGARYLRLPAYGDTTRLPDYPTTRPTILDDEFGLIYPPDVIEEDGHANDWRNLVGTGPMMLTDWVEGSSFTHTKNPDYWGHDENIRRTACPMLTR